jgi:hypothetical protein
VEGELGADSVLIAAKDEEGATLPIPAPDNVVVTDTVEPRYKNMQNQRHYR